MALVAALAALAAYLLLWPVPIDPVEWTPPPDPGLQGAFAPNDRLSGAERLIPGQAGPEDVTRGPDGLLYTGLADGRIVRFRPEPGAVPETFADTGGRPLGLQFDARGHLVVADALRGLLSVDPSGEVSLLTDSVQGERMLFVDDLDIAADGTIWFSDASRRFSIHENTFDFLEGRPTGRLLSYDPETGRTAVRLDRLRFANGVALGPGDEYVLVNETVGARILRLWLRGARAGRREVFLELPAYPDNLSYNDAGLFWVALPAPRSSALDDLAGSPFARRLLAHLPLAWLGFEPEPFGWVIAVSPAGQIVHNLQDPWGGYSTITSVNEFDGQLYLGSIQMDGVGRIAAPGA